MRATWLCVAGVVVAGSMVSGVALAQTPDIVLFQGNGELTWTNSNTNLFYQIEWAPSLTVSGAWHSTYISLTDVRSSSSLVTSSVPMFYRVSGSSNRMVNPAPVEKTGQSGSFGVAWPTPRFTLGTDVSSNCVKDNLTGLMWLRSSPGKMGWVEAITYCEGLDGAAGRGGYSDWRLPNIKELQSLIDFGQGFPAALPSGHPFTGVEMEFLMSSTTAAGNTSNIWGIYSSSGEVVNEPIAGKNDAFLPVRGGQ